MNDIINRIMLYALICIQIQTGTDTKYKNLIYQLNQHELTLSL